MSLSSWDTVIVHLVNWLMWNFIPANNCGTGINSRHGVRSFNKANLITGHCKNSHQLEGFFFWLFPPGIWDCCAGSSDMASVACPAKKILGNVEFAICPEHYTLNCPDFRVSCSKAKWRLCWGGVWMFCWLLSSRENLRKMEREFHRSDRTRKTVDADGEI